jgi:uncharacterized protein (TIGR03435 family)
VQIKEIAVNLIRTGLVLVGAVGLAFPQAGTVRPQFEVASVKLNTEGGPGMTIRPSAGGRLDVENITVRQLIRIAYGIMESQISGGPGWIDSDHFDISAKAENSVAFEDMRPMLQSLLADRFQLAVRRNVKELSVYALAVTKGGIKFAQSRPESCIAPLPGAARADGEPPVFCGSIQMRRGRLDAPGISMTRMVRVLTDFGNLGRPVVDSTGLTGTFDIHLVFAPDEADTGEPPPSVDPAVPSIFTALQEQLGLRLESSKSPVDVLVIDRVERPSAN